MKKLLFTLTLLHMAFMAHAATQINGIYYNLNSSTKTAQVTRGSNKYTGAVSIPSTVTFSGYSYRVTSIGEDAFRQCSSLTSITIPNSVTSIGRGAFSHCSNITTIKVDANNPKYDSRNNCNAIIETASNTLITGCMSTIIPNSVTSIGFSAFYGSGLTSAHIPNSVTSIGDHAFFYCTGLASVTIPNSVTSIGKRAFSQCSSLTSITIPNSVTSIGDYAFAWCSSLTFIDIPNSVTSIGNFAFYACRSLISVTVENPTPVTIEQYTFTNRANATLYVPTGSKSAYQAANYWKEFKEIVEKNMNHDAGLGDVNGDGEISISDVTLLVDYLLEQAGDNFILANADVNKDDRISVSDAVSIIKLILEGEPEPQAYLTCPDDHHPHLIDLGLPSGTKWACCNVGADKPEGYGGYYAWGETEEKDRYDWSTYIHCDGSSSTCHNLGDDIAGTQYDVAHVKWGGSWVMPTKDQIQELLDNCTYEYSTINGINGNKFTSNNNGGSIFMPAAGANWLGSLHDADNGNYWSSTKSSSTVYAKYLNFNLDNAYLKSSFDRKNGLTVRPVSK